MFSIGKHVHVKFSLAGLSKVPTDYEVTYARPDSPPVVLLVLDSLEAEHEAKESSGVDLTPDGIKATISAGSKILVFITWDPGGNRHVLRLKIHDNGQIERVDAAPKPQPPVLIRPRGKRP